jgi:hypothetical protein
MDDVRAATIQDATEVVKRPTHVQVGHVHMPVLKKRGRSSFQG